MRVRLTEHGACVGVMDTTWFMWRIWGWGRVALGIPSHIWENNIVVQLEGLGGFKSLRLWICIYLAHCKVFDADSCDHGDGSELHRSRVSWTDD
jgi:hypothetical protein